MASTYLERTLGTPTSQRIFTISAWIKRGGLTAHNYIIGQNSTNESYFRINDADQLDFQDRDAVSGPSDFGLTTNALLRDVSAWYHVVLSVDTTQATNTDRGKLYINGELQTLSASTYPPQNYDTMMNLSGATQRVGRVFDYFNGSMAHVHFIDGTAYAASAFGETDATTGIWKPKTAPSVTYGTNGFFLRFANSGSMGTDSSGNGNNFTVNGNLTQTQDTPSNVFCSMLGTAPGASSLLSNLNLTVTKAASSHSSVPGSLAVNTGKWYFEAKANTVGPTVNGTAVGIARIDSNAFYASGHNAGDTNDYVYTAGAEQQVNNTASSYGNTYTSGDIIGVAFDLDNNKLYFSKNGTYQNSGVPTSGATGTGAISITSGDYFTALAGAYGGTVWDFNFGNGYFGTTAVSSANSDDAGFGLFEYAPPTGYYSLCTKNINTYG